MVIAAATTMTHSSRNCPAMRSPGRRMASRMATNWTVVLSLPHIDGCMTAPSAATTARRPRMMSSRPTMIAAIQLDTRSAPTSAMSTPETSSLSAVVSRNEPSVVVISQRRASQPSRKSVAAATANSAAAATDGAPGRSPGSARISAITTGAMKIRNDVPAATKRAERMPRPGVVSVATRRPMLAARPAVGDERAHGRGVVEIERGGGQPGGLAGVQPAHDLLDLVHQPGGHAQLGDAEADEQDGGVRVAGQLAADPDPAAVRGRAAHDVAHEREQRGHRPVGQRGQCRVAALGGQRVLGQVVRADREEVDL